MTDLIVFALGAITMGVIILTLGLALISKSLEPMEYNSRYDFGHSTEDYYNNPLYKLQSKWFYYRPKGSIIVSKAQWDQIEKSIALKIEDAKRMGKILGRKSMLVEIQDEVQERKAKIFPTSPYAVLGVDSTTDKADIRLKYQHMLKIYDPKNFVDLDKAFIELAEIRQKQFNQAWRKITVGVGGKGKT